MAVLLSVFARRADHRDLSSGEHRGTVEDPGELRIAELLHRKRTGGAILEL